MIVPQHEHREAAADAIEYAIENLETPAHAQKLRDLVAKVMAKLDAKWPAPVVCHCCGESPAMRLNSAGSHFIWTCACWSLASSQSRELAHLNDVLARKNRELDALHYVWCSGACEGGTHRYGGELTEEIVVEAERNTRRLRERWDALAKGREPVDPDAPDMSAERREWLEAEVAACRAFLAQEPADAVVVRIQWQDRLEVAEAEMKRQESEWMYEDLKAMGR